MAQDPKPVPEIEMVLIHDEPGHQIYQTNLFDVLRALVDESKTSIDLLIGPKQ